MASDEELQKEGYGDRKVEWVMKRQKQVLGSFVRHEGWKGEQTPVEISVPAGSGPEAACIFEIF